MTGSSPLRYGRRRRAPGGGLAVRGLLLGACLSGCGVHPSQDALPVVATTTLVGDAVRVVGGDRISLTVLLPVGADPHTFQPTPRDVAALSRARVVFTNGFGLEGFLEPLLEGSVSPERLVALSEGIEPLHAGDEDEHHHEVDPHVWFVPSHVAHWARRVAKELAEVDPDHASYYVARADSYAVVLDSLDAWVARRLATIPPDRRLIVTDHSALGYFARRYGFREAGALHEGVSTLEEPSARRLADRIGLVRSAGIPAVFASVGADVTLLQGILSGTDVRIVRLYIGSLSGPEGPARDYVSFMRHNVEALVSGLTRGTGEAR